MRSWVFRNRARLEAIYGRQGGQALPAEREGNGRPGGGLRVRVLQPVRVRASRVR